jgi:GLPGLI family protein
MIFSKLISKSLLAFFALSTTFSFSQITAGKITYERKTNLMKKFSDERSRKWITEDNKYVIDKFELSFNDSISIYLPVEDNSKKGMMAMATTKNSVIQNHNSGARTSIINIWGENAYVQDSIVKREWKITENHRKVGKYQCTKAVFEMNDSTRIYAWFSEEIIPSIGPETFRGLPGAILGLATEDGGVVYFASKVELLNPNMEEINPKVGKKVFTQKELKTKLENDFGDKPWAKGMVEEFFMW